VVLIDAHTHVFAPAQVARRDELVATDSTFAELYGSPRAKMATAAGLLGAIDEAGVDRAIVAGFAFAGEENLAAHNEYLLASAAEAGGRLAPLATVNPALPGWERAARGWLDRGAAGFGELRPHNQGWDPLGTAGRRLCALAGEAGSLLLWHVSEPVGHAYPGKTGGIGPVELYELAAAFPGVTMVGAHFGGGLPFYLMMPEVRAAVPRLFFDTAAATLLYDQPGVARLVELAGAGRVLFGSDFPLLTPRRQLERVLAQLPDGVSSAVCGGNAEILLSETQRR
jgi:predicted TIM-barrel fold metal-dependent hydrolase